MKVLIDIHCRDCRHTGEVMVRISEQKGLHKCPLCGKGNASKIQRPPNFKLNGNGWFNSGGY